MLNIICVLFKHNSTGNIYSVLVIQYVSVKSLNGSLNSVYILTLVKAKVSQTKGCVLCVTIPAAL